MDVIHDLVSSIVNLRYGDLRENVVEATKRFIIDSVGVAIAGSSAPYNAEIIGLLREWGGKEESTIIVYGNKLPSPEAAFANSLLIDSLDFDDSHDGSLSHTMVTALPAALTTAERTKNDGKALILAVVVGVEITTRLGAAPRLFHGWHYSSIAGVFGAATAAGKILGLDEEEMVNALGIAYAQAAGNRQGRQDGALTKRLQPAFATKAGVTSALLAQRGITGARNIIEGEWGFFRLFRDYSKEFEPEKWAAKFGEGLGMKFGVLDLDPKAYPCVKASHAAITGTIELVEEYDIRPEVVEEVTIYTNPKVLETCGKPFVIRTTPQVDAQFSIPYTVAVALTRRKVGLSDFEEGRIRDSKILQMASRVKVLVNTEFQAQTSVTGPVEIRIKTKGRKEFVGKAFAKGTSHNPMTPDELARKFHDCAKYSAKPLSDADIAILKSTLEELERVEDLDEMIRLTC